MPRILLEADSLDSPIRCLRGKVGDVVFYRRGDKLFARSAGVVSNPRTPDQDRIREFLGNASRAWQHLSPSQRLGWENYGDEQARLKLEPAEPDLRRNRNGIAAFTRANSMRQLLGLPLVADAPSGPPPPAPCEVMLVEGPAAVTLSIRVVHGIRETAGLLLLVRMTPQMVTQARRPRKTEMRLVCGMGPESAAPLDTSGAVYTFGPTRFCVAEGKRFGVEVKVVRESDGIAGEACYGDFLATNLGLPANTHYPQRES